MLTDDAGTNSTYPTKFDVQRINELGVGDYMDGEKGNFRVLKYKESYVVLLFNSPSKNEYSEFSTLKQVFAFLKT